MLIIVSDPQAQGEHARGLPLVRHVVIRAPVLHRAKHLAEQNRKTIRIGRGIGRVERSVPGKREQPDVARPDDVDAAVLARAHAELQRVLGRRKRQLLGEQRGRDVRTARVGIGPRQVIGVRLPRAEVELVGSLES